ncbi:MAG: hypothetical protein [Microvirus sp.]|nr:MAG: hypothetical protein [Microvirus sp.]
MFRDIGLSCNCFQCRRDWFHTRIPNIWFDIKSFFRSFYGF